ncbi:MAG: hypothetical protein RBT49_01175 [Bacteroidales bacterium]|jgi:hypothetical protein|nr:hypothetical protein [Bacteroidales bacterium]
MAVNKIIKYFNKNPKDFPLGYTFLEIIEVIYKHKHSSRSNIHNSDRYVGGLFYKEISNMYRFNEKQERIF